MEFEKKVMKISELKKIGFSEDYLLEIARHPNQDFAWKQNPGKINSPLLFDTDRLQKFLDKQIAVQKGKQCYGRW